MKRKPNNTQNFAQSLKTPESRQMDGTEGTFRMHISAKKSNFRYAKGKIVLAIMSFLVHCLLYVVCELLGFTARGYTRREEIFLVYGSAMFYQVCSFTEERKKKKFLFSSMETIVRFFFFVVG